MAPHDSMIRVDNLRKTFGTFVAVNSISFTVSRGEIFAFLGPNGAGKSTTMKMLATILRPTAGTIVLNGFDPLLERDEVRRSFGIVFQDPSLDDELTAYENLEFHGILYAVPRVVRQQRIEELLDLVDLSERRSSLIKTFSGGMKRRLEIARGLLHHPKILFLDEPTLGLDPQTKNAIWDYILKLNKSEEITVFFTTHNMEEASKVASRIAIIDKGSIIAQGSAIQLEHLTKSNTLEDAFLSLTGKSVRDESADSLDKMRMRSKIWRH